MKAVERPRSPGARCAPAEIIKPALAKILRDYESRLPHEPTDGGVFIPQNLCLMVNFALQSSLCQYESYKRNPNSRETGWRPMSLLFLHNA
jgi:hypothetical protein